MRKLNIGIVGCGVAGCAAALFLARDGHAVTLFEQTPRVGPIGAGVLLQTSGQRVLASLGLLERVIARSDRIEELTAYTHRGRLLSRLRFADLPGDFCAYGIHRGDLFAALHDALDAAGVNLRTNLPIERIGSDGRSLVTQSSASLGPFDLIVAADGSRSRLRTSAGLPVFVHNYRPAALWAVGGETTVHGRLLQHTHHTKKLCGLLPMGGGRCSFFYGLNVDEWPTLQRSTFDAWRRRVITFMPPAAPLLEKLSSFGDLMFTTYRAVLMPRVTRGRVVFIGDAAHAASPLLGHGINLAMLDARDLAAAVREEMSMDAALHRYNRTQRFRNGYYGLLSAALNPSFQGQSTVIGVARDFFLPKMQRVPILRTAMLRTLTGVIR